MTEETKPRSSGRKRPANEINDSRAPLGRAADGTKRAMNPRQKSSKRMLYLLLGLTLCIGGTLIWLYPMVMVSAGRQAVIRIPQNATPEMVYDSLRAQLDDKYSQRVIQLARLRHADFSKRFGQYTIQEDDNALVAMRRLTSGAQTPVRITINGFRSLPLLIERISRKMAFPADSLRAVLNDKDFLGRYGLTPEQALALFVDDTYEVYWTQSARDIVEKMAENYRYVWNDTRTKQAAELGMTPVGMMTIASITDEETNDENEKGTIGRLYINRLQNNMKLQADPTVRFAIGDFTLQRITKADLKFESPYNTYLHNGLPPGPIRTTSLKTVKKILQTPEHGYLFMCAKEDFSGSHNFATTYDEHLRNASKYQAELDRRGITR